MTASRVSCRPSFAAVSKSASIRERAERTGWIRGVSRLPRRRADVPERGRRVQAVIEVETAESVNNLEAIAQWAQFARLRQPFHLYVPASSVDVARRLCSDNSIPVAEIQSYHVVGSQMRFTPVYRAPVSSRPAARTPRTRSRRAGNAPQGLENETRERSRDKTAPAIGQIGAQALSRTEAQIALAIPSVRPRHARLREHVSRAHGPSTRKVAAADPVLLPHTARRQGRPWCAR